MEEEYSRDCRRCSDLPIAAEWGGGGTLKSPVTRSICYTYRHFPIYVCWLYRWWFVSSNWLANWETPALSQPRLIPLSKYCWTSRATLLPHAAAFFLQRLLIARLHVNRHDMNKTSEIWECMNLTDEYHFSQYTETWLSVSSLKSLSLFWGLG